MAEPSRSTPGSSFGPRRRSRLRRPVTDRSESEAGFALLVALLALVGLTALATGGFLMANSERKTATNYDEVVDALYVADAGLSQYLGTHRGIPAGSQTYSYGARGSATVTPLEVVDLGAPGSMWEVRSTGTTSSGTSRTVHTVAFLNFGLLPVPQGALTSAQGITKNGTSGSIDGTDGCGVEGTKAGVVLPPGGWSGSAKMVTGNPAIKQNADPYNGVITASQWQSILDGGRIPHQYNVPPDAFPDFGSLPSDAWPVIYVDGNADLDSGMSGRGVLIVKDNATFGGSWNWDGLVMVGGAVTDNGQGQMNGALMTGLNTLLGQSVGANDLGNVLNGTKRYGYHSCNLASAAQANAVLVQEPGTWSQVF
jgi:hypothetical protein